MQRYEKFFKYANYFFTFYFLPSSRLFPIRDFGWFWMVQKWVKFEEMSAVFT